MICQSNSDIFSFIYLFFSPKWVDILMVFMGFQWTDLNLIKGGVRYWCGFQDFYNVTKYLLNRNECHKVVHFINW